MNRCTSYNGYDVVIVKTGDIYANPKYTSTIDYIDIRDFIADVYTNGTANHTYDGHLGYIVLVGDALMDDNSTEMVPAAYPSYYGNLERGGDYYYACTGGNSDNILDLMYGRLSVVNETELSNVVDKIIDYEKYSSGTWRNNVTLISHAPWFFDEDAQCDQEFRNMAQTIPQNPYYISYAWRGFAADTAQAWGRPNFRHHTTDDVSQVLVPDEVDEMWNRIFTGWRWGYYPNYSYGGQFADPNDYCGTDELRDWLYNKINLAQLHHNSQKTAQKRLKNSIKQDVSSIFTYKIGKCSDP